MKLERSFEDLFKLIIDCLNQVKIEFVIVGGAVLPYYGRTRTTEDIDIMILSDNISVEQINNFVSIVKENSLSITKEEFEDALYKNVHCTIIDMIGFAFRIDLKKIRTKLDRLTFETKRTVEMHGILVPISAPESLIAVKSMSGFRSETDIEDIITLIEITEHNYQLINQFFEITDSKQFLCKTIKSLQSDKIKQFQKNINCMY